MRDPDPRAASPAPPPAVSVLLPVYQHGAFLGRAIESVLAQGFGDWELLVADDGSTDGSLAVAERYRAGSARVRVLALEHRGLSATLNAAAAVATADVLTFLDADDAYEPHHLEENLRYLAEHPEADLVTSTARILGDPFVVDLERPGEMIHLDRCVIGGTFFVRRRVFAAVGGMPEARFGMDYLFARAIGAAGYAVHRRQGRSYVYDRTHGGSMSKRAEQRMRVGEAAEPEP